MLRAHLEDKGNDGPAQLSTANNTPSLKSSLLRVTFILQCMIRIPNTAVLAVILAIKHTIVCLETNSP